METDVVYCKDCIYYEIKKSRSFYRPEITFTRCYCTRFEDDIDGFLFETEEDDFCSRAKRRKNAKSN